MWWVLYSVRRAARTSVAGAQQAARFYIELTLFIRFALEPRSINLPCIVLVCASISLTTRRPVAPESLFRFVCFYGTRVNTQNARSEDNRRHQDRR